MQNRSTRKSRKSGPKKKKTGRKKGAVKDDSATHNSSISLKPPYNEEHLENLKRLAAIGATHREVSAFFNISPNTLNEHCKQFYGDTYWNIYKQNFDRSTISVRRALWHKAIDEKYWPALRYLLNNRTEMRDSPEPSDADSGRIVFTSEIGSSGEIIKQISTGEDLKNAQTFDPSQILNEANTIDIESSDNELDEAFNDSVEDRPEK